MDKKKLSKRLRVLIEIRKHYLEKNHGIGFNELVERMDGMERPTVSQCLDSLHDMCIISADWDLSNGTWKRGIVVRGESQSFVDEIIRDVDLKLPA